MASVTLLRVPRALSNGDGIALVSPASWSEPAQIEETNAVIESWGFRPRVGAHVRDRVGYLAGTDEDRLADLNESIRDPEVRAIVCLRGGCGSSRLLHGVDVDALEEDPKPLVGFSDITALHRVWHQHGVPSLHGAVAGAHQQVVKDVLMGGTPAPVAADPRQFGAELTTRGRATGALFGGNLEMLARSVGVLDFDVAGHVLLLEINRSAGLGHVDRALTQLIMAGALDGVVGGGARMAVWIRGPCRPGLDDHRRPARSALRVGRPGPRRSAVRARPGPAGGATGSAVHDRCGRGPRHPLGGLEVATRQILLWRI